VNTFMPVRHTTQSLPTRAIANIVQVEPRSDPGASPKRSQELHLLTQEPQERLGAPMAKAYGLKGLIGHPIQIDRG